MILAALSFGAPWVLAALAGLPLLWWLLRVTPPAPRTESFPALALLLGLRATEETPARTPWWLLALRLMAAALVILALARPVLDAGAALEGDGPVLLVIDNGWASAPGWQKRLQAAGDVLDRAERAGRKAALLATAPDEAGVAPVATAPMPVPDLRPRLAALRPLPWPPDRAAAATAMPRWAGASVVYIGDGLGDAAFAGFADALSAAGSVTQICCDATPIRAMLPPETEADRLVARVVQVPLPVASQIPVLARGGDGGTLARAVVTIPAGEATGRAGIALPTELRNTLTRLVLDGPPSAGSVVLLDERWRRRPVGLLAGDLASADAPFAGALYYLHRALAPHGDVRSGDLEALLKRELAVLVLADRPLPPGDEYDALAKWVNKGGLLIRFAGPRMAEEPDDLVPVRLLGGDRQLGGALSWSEPTGLAPFPAASPFAGLAVPNEVKIARQILAEPSPGLPDHTWAALGDGTPLVTQAARGAGRVVLFHVTANAEWSNLPLSGLFVDMLRRLTALSAGVAVQSDATVLAPAETLDGYGVLSPPPRAATGLAGDAFARTAVSPRHPPGLYGPEAGRRALNLGATIGPLIAAPPIPGVRIQSLTEGASERDLAPLAMTVAVVLLLVDMLISILLRGLLRSRIAIAALAALLLFAPPARALDAVENPALATRLGYILSGDEQVDGIAKAGLVGLSDFVNRRTSATLSMPDAVEPGRTDLSVYPLLYWPISADAAALSAGQIAALNDYMSRGGIIVIDTRDSGSGAGFAPGAASALRRIAQGLTVPVLAPLTTDHVLARAFYLLTDFPGRFTGEQVWAQRDQDRANDSISPVIIGGHDWAAAWATDAAGRNPYAVLPGGQRQRVMAYRFGLNLVIYALTGNYKGDQVHVPAILQRLGQ